MRIVNLYGLLLRLGKQSADTPCADSYQFCHTPDTKPGCEKRCCVPQKDAAGRMFRIVPTGTAVAVINAPRRHMAILAWPPCEILFQPEPLRSFPADHNARGNGTTN